jgi:hypothetical protein
MYKKYWWNRNSFQIMCSNYRATYLMVHTCPHLTLHFFRQLSTFRSRNFLLRQGRGLQNNRNAWHEWIACVIHENITYCTHDAISKWKWLIKKNSLELSGRCLPRQTQSHWSTEVRLGAETVLRLMTDHILPLQSTHNGVSQFLSNVHIYIIALTF